MAILENGKITGITLADSPDSAVTVGIVQDAFANYTPPSAQASATKPRAGSYVYALPTYVPKANELELNSVQPISAFDTEVFGPTTVNYSETVIERTPVSGDRFGSAIAINPTSEYMVVGASGKGSTGSAFVYTKDFNTNQWVFSFDLTPLASNLAVGANFGFSVDINYDGSTIIVGAPNDNGRQTNSGSVYIFDRSTNNQWMLQQRIIGSNAVTGDRMGHSVAIEGVSNGLTYQNGSISYALIGAPNASGKGFVYTISRPANSQIWSVLNYFSNATLAGANFGSSVSLIVGQDSSYALVGAPNDRNTSNTNKPLGLVAIYGLGNTNVTYLSSPETGTLNGAFGTSISVDRNTNSVVVGDPLANSTGRAYIFTPLPSGSNSRPTTLGSVLIPQNPINGDMFGKFVKFTNDGSRVYVGVQESNTSSSRVDVFYRARLDPKGNAPIYTYEKLYYITSIRPSVAQANAKFGLSIAADGYSGNLVIGAESYGTGGSIFFEKYQLSTTKQKFGFYDISDENLDTPVTTSTSNSSKFSSDGSVAVVSIGTTISGSQRAFVYEKTNGKYKRTTALTPTTVGIYFVEISGDGSTIIIGCRSDTGIAANTGAAYIYKKINNTWTLDAKISVTDGAANDFFGLSAYLSNDGNTAIIGASGDDYNGLTDAGSAYIYIRTANGTWEQQARLTPTDAASSIQFGFAVALTSDGNTALVSALNGNTGLASSGAAYVFVRVNGTWTQKQKLDATGLISNCLFGNTLNISKDGNFLCVGGPGIPVQFGARTLSSAGTLFLYRKDSQGLYQNIEKIIPRILLRGNTQLSYGIFSPNSTKLLVSYGEAYDSIDSSVNASFYVFDLDYDNSLVKLRSFTKPTSVLNGTEPNVSFIDNSGDVYGIGYDSAGLANQRIFGIRKYSPSYLHDFVEPLAPLNGLKTIFIKGN